MRQVPAGVERHADHPLVTEGAPQRRPILVGEIVHLPNAGGRERGRLDALREHGPERHQVGVDARVRLDVRVRCAEQRAGVFGGELLDGVDVPATRVEAVTDRPLRVLVAQPGAHRQQHGGRGVVLAGDQLQGLALIGELLPHRCRDVGLDGSNHLERIAVGGGRRCGVERGWSGDLGHGASRLVTGDGTQARGGNAEPLPGGEPPYACASHGSGESTQPTETK